VQITTSAFILFMGLLNRQIFIETVEDIKDSFFARATQHVRCSNKLLPLSETHIKIMEQIKVKLEEFTLLCVLKMSTELGLIKSNDDHFQFGQTHELFLVKIKFNHQIFAMYAKISCLFFCDYGQII
jgi:hypothetical protein